MVTYADNCPRCLTKNISFDVKGLNHFDDIGNFSGTSFPVYEFYCVCRECYKTTIFIGSSTSSRVDLSSINLEVATFRLADVANISRALSPADLSVGEPPDSLPEKISDAYKEGAKCIAIGCYNAAAAMFRLCLDYATKKFLPEGDDGPNAKIRRSLGLRMEWLFTNNYVPPELRDLAECVKDDGNDGAHDGNLDEITAKDLEEFTYLLLERLYTEPARIAEAKNRREARKKNGDIL